METEVIHDATIGRVREVSFLAYMNNIYNQIGFCSVEIKPNATAEIYTFRTNEPHRRKGHGSKLWSFVENYLTQKHQVKRFIGELNLRSEPTAIKFWEKQGFEIKHKNRNVAYAVKSLRKSDRTRRTVPITRRVTPFRKRSVTR